MTPPLLAQKVGGGRTVFHLGTYGSTPLQKTDKTTDNGTSVKEMFTEM